MTDVHADRPAEGVLRLTLDGPQTLNALDDGAKDRLLEQLRALHRDRSVRVLLLTGSGRAFCSGGDIRRMGERSTVETVDVLVHGRQIIEALARLQLPVVAAVNGVAAGAGFNLALAADVLLASAEAYFQQSFVRMGLVPDLGGTYLLARQVGLYRAKEILLSARKVSAQEAHRLGLVAEVVEDDLAGRSVEYCAGMAHGATRALGLTKLLVNKAVEGSLSDALDAEMLGQSVLGQTDDHKLAVRAFLDKQRGPLPFEGK